MSEVIGTVFTILIVIVLGINLFYMFREEGDERGQRIFYRPTSRAFSFLIAGYFTIRMVSEYRTFDYQIGVDILFGVGILYYFVYLLIMRRLHS